MRAIRGPILKAAGVITALGMAVAVGYLAAPSLRPSISQQSTSVGAADPGGKVMTYGSAGSAAVADGGVPLTSPSPESPSPVLADATARMVVKSASMELRVRDADNSLKAIRAIASASRSEISNLVVTAGDLPVQPVPLTADANGSVVSGPVNAQVTLRVPAEHLASVQRDISKLGTVLSQNVAEDDVTQQHVDMTARLKNLRAEEVRLRSFLTRTAKVSELLEVERELARVRGEIESMQAQVTYLERQAAMATLVVSLSEPGPVVSPGTGGWGLSQAVTDGVRAAAALVRAAITVIIAVLPVAVVIGTLVLVVALLRRRRRRVLPDSGTDAE